LRSQLNADVTSISPEYPPRDGGYDYVAVAAANFLFSGFDFGAFADLIEAIDLPCVMVGLGAQAPKSGHMPDIAPGTKRFVQAIADRTYRIGVRGAYTAEVLDTLGIRNVQITGCPSFYLYPPDTIAERHARKRQTGRISFNGSRNVMSHSGDPKRMQRHEAAVYRACHQTDSQFVLQSELEELAILTSSDPAQDLQQAARIRESLALDLTVEEVRDLVKSKFKIHFDIDQWAQGLSDVDFSLGTRFHGNLIALLSGVPAHVICHDSRTQELCEFSGIPHTTLGELDLDADILSLRNESDVGPFLARQYKNYEAYRIFLEKSGVSHNLQPARVSSGAEKVMTPA
jgi:polysaccharide pyruvyl transferase WcaK-like protein